MHPLPLPLLVLCSAIAAEARVHWSLATEDLYAFPKYRISFLNGLPVLNETAERWLAGGLAGGELEFLEQPWRIPPQTTASSGVKAITGSSEIQDEDSISGSDAAPPGSETPRFQLQHMKLSSKSSYICLIPPPVESHTHPVDESPIEPNPVQTWSLLQPLSGTCLFHRQGWFTYAYCHNNHVRQFRERAYSHPHSTGYVPEEDHEWEAFTLGQAATIPSEVQELTSAQQAALTSNVDIARTPGHRYLVQRWGDGTICDKTGRPREIEVQFHCSTITTDTILFVKETRTCHYVMVIHTPRLCGEPGFKTRLEQRDEAFIRCREVVDSVEAIESVDRSLPEAPYPFVGGSRRQVNRDPTLGAVPLPPPAVSAGEEGNRAEEGSADTVSDEQDARTLLDKNDLETLKRAFEAFLSGSNNHNNNHNNNQNRDHNADNTAQTAGDSSSVHVVPGKDGEVYIEFIDLGDEELQAADLEERIQSFLAGASGKLGRLEEILRAAGYDVEVGVAGSSPDSGSGASEERREHADGTDGRKRGGKDAKKPASQHEEL